MPYKNIHWIKLEKRLLNDYRFYIMSEKAQLTYLKLLMIAAETSNKIPKTFKNPPQTPLQTQTNLEKPPKTPSILLTIMRSRMSEEELVGCIKEIRQNFPKFKEGKDFYYFYEWANRCNWITAKELRGNSKGTPEEGADKIDKSRIDKIRIEYIRLKGLSIENFDSNDFGRTAKAIKTLLLKSNGQDNRVVEALKWVSEKDYIDWTLETVIKKWPDFMKYDSTPDLVKEYGGANVTRK